MKKYTLSLTFAAFALLGVVSGANFAHAATIATGTQANAGTITSLEYTFSEAGQYYGGCLYSQSQVNILINSSTVWSGVYSLETGGVSADTFTHNDVGVSPQVYFYPGDDIQATVSCTFGSGYVSLDAITLYGDTTFSIDTPANGSTLSDFSDWVIEYPTAATPGTLRVNYSPASGGAGSTGTDTIDFSPFVNPNPVSIIKSQPLFFPPLEPPLFYNATATLYNASGSVQYIATSTFEIIAPYVGPSTPVATSSLCGDIPPAFFGTSSTQPYFYVISPIPDIQYGLCTSFIYLFLPSSPQRSDISARYNSAAAIMSAKPPFGYFVLAADALGSFASGSSTISLLPTASSTAALSPIFSPLDDGLAAAIGLLGIFWLLRRLKHIQP